MAFARKKEDVFFNMLQDIAENLKNATQYFMDEKIESEEDLRNFSNVMKDYETQGDTYIHELIVELNKTFITPLEREDMLALAVKMDDILDGLEACASRLDMYYIVNPNQYMISFAEQVNHAVKEIAKSAKLLKKKRLMDIRPHAIKINEYESKCDELLRMSIKDLFIEEENPMTVIQYKEIYEFFEEVSDSCEHVANTLETIIMRNS